MIDRAEGISHVSLAHLIGFPSSIGAEILPAQDLSSADIDNLERTALHLEEELRQAASAFRKQSRYGTKLRTCFDFDVPYAASEWLTQGNRNSLWSALSIDFNSRNSVLLPGMLYELLSYARRLKDWASGQLGTSLSAAFINAFEANEIKSLTNELYTPIVNQIRRNRLTRGIYYSFESLRQSIVERDVTLPFPDNDIFRSAVHLLSRGNRTEKIINNRVDALNFAINFELNASQSRNDERFVIVTNSASMFALNRYFSSGLLRGDPYESDTLDLIWSPRQVALHQMLLQVADEEADAEKLAWSLVEKIMSYRLQLNRLRAKGSKKRITTDDIRVHDSFIEMMYAFAFMQNTINRASSHQDSEFEVFGRKFGKEAAPEFFERVHAFASARFKDDQYKDFLRGRIGYKKNTSALKLKEIGAKEDFGISHMYQMVAANEFVVSNSALDKTGIVVWLKSASNLSEFIGTVNQVVQSLKGKFAEGTYDASRLGVGLKEIDVALSSTLTVVAEAGRSIQELEAGREIDLSKCLEKASIRAEDVRFLRIDTDLVSFSFEGSFKVMRTRVSCLEEVVLFVSELVDGLYKRGVVDFGPQGILPKKVIERGSFVLGG